jgi:uncharacterized protein (DUF4213/DUF364 family)
LVLFARNPQALKSMHRLKVSRYLFIVLILDVFIIICVEKVAIRVYYSFICGETNQGNFMQILEQILDSLPSGQVKEVRIGLHWTAVVVETAGETLCGLASTLYGAHDHRRTPDVPQAGELENTSANELARWVLGPAPVMASLGLAAINALLPRQPQLWSDENASEIIARFGAGKRVVMVGRFPFAAEILPRLGELLILEQDPGPDDLPAEAAPQVLPGADVVAITGMTISNHTLESLLSLCNPQAKVVLLGPSTPLSLVFFEHGVDVVSGAVVTAIQPVLRLVSQGGNFRQVHHGGVRLVNIYK